MRAPPLTTCFVSLRRRPDGIDLAEVREVQARGAEHLFRRDDARPRRKRVIRHGFEIEEPPVAIQDGFDHARYDGRGIVDAYLSDRRGIQRARAFAIDRAQWGIGREPLGPTMRL